MLNLPDASTDYVTRTTGLIAASGNYSCVFWWRNIVDDVVNGAVLFERFQDPNAQLAAVWNFGSGNIVVVAQDGATFLNTTPFAFTMNKFYPIAYTYNATTHVHSFYVAGVLIGTITLNINAFSLIGENLGNDGVTTSHVHQQITGFKEWNVVLSTLAINDEINSYTAVVTPTNLSTFTPLVNNLLDVSGNGHNWTSIGGPTFVSEPPFPANTAQSTALDLSGATFPYSASLNMFMDSYTFELWISILPLANSMISSYAFGGTVGSGYQPNQIFLDTDGSTELYRSGNDGVGQLALTTGVKRWINIFPDVTTNPNPAVLTLSIQQLAVVTVPPGSIGVNDDTGGFPLMIASATADQILAYHQPFPNGESGAILLDGTLLLEDSDNGNCKLFDSNYNQIAVVALNNILYIGYDQARTQFFVAYSSGGHTKVQRVSKTGVIDATVFDLGAIAALGVVADATYIYYQITGAVTTIKRWTIATNSAASDLVATTAGFGAGKDMIILTDGTLVTMLLKDPGNLVRRYDNTGATLNTYTPTTHGASADRMAPDRDTGYFYYWSQVSTKPSVFYRIKASDGTTTSKNQTIYEGGALNNSPTSSPSARFGVSFSCPFWLTAVASGTGGLYQLVPGKTNDTIKQASGGTLNVMINWFAELFTSRDK